jgi:hypothetical protein
VTYRARAVLIVDPRYSCRAARNHMQNVFLPKDRRHRTRDFNNCSIITILDFYIFTSKFTAFAKTFAQIIAFGKIHELVVER